MFLRLVIVFLFMFGLTFAGAVTLTTWLSSIIQHSVQPAQPQYVPESVRWKKEIEAELAKTAKTRATRATKPTKPNRGATKDGQ